ncbi:MAG TPA: Sua5 family C-terminal domain-containing protein, partial [Saprospiraceae bacterium]|nr:Sua5 family C-terminal domain-containing protein [Saprospiraceae bacterium]
CFGQNKRQFAKSTLVFDLSPQQDLAEAAKNLFNYMRQLDNSAIDIIVAERVDAKGLGLGINDRLTRAAVK